MASRADDIMLLLGAGASADAGIPTSAAMIEKIEGKLGRDTTWKRFAGLYNHVKSAIHYAAGLHGRFNSEVPYNIETLVNTLYELERNEQHPLYPFIASWNSRFVALAEPDFSKVKEFRSLILSALKKWMCPDDTSRGDYYRGLASLQRDINFPLRVFSLNYDLCVERVETLVGGQFRVEAGFAGHGPQHEWDWERFDGEGPDDLPQIVLYKLHGSINWKRDPESRKLYSVEQIEGIDAGSMEVIFGRDFKLEAADPYLFYAYEFRRYALKASLLVSVGYGFGDSHINKMIVQGLRVDPKRRLLTVEPTEKPDEVRDRIAETLELPQAERDRLIVENGTAKTFLERDGLSEFIQKHIPADVDAPF